MPPISAKRLFLLYAHPCGDVLVKRGTVSRRALDSLRSALMGHGKLPSAQLFSAAFSRLQEYAGKRKRKITPALVREYFLAQHNKVVLRVAKKKKDVIPKRCFIVPGRLLKLGKGKAAASTPFGSRKIIIGLVPKLKTGDMVAIHYDYACETIPQAEFRRLWRELA